MAAEIAGARRRKDILIFIQNLIGPGVFGSSANIRLRVNRRLVKNEAKTFQGAVDWMGSLGNSVRVRVAWNGQVLKQRFLVDSKPERRGFELNRHGRLRWRHNGHYE